MFAARPLVRRLATAAAAKNASPKLTDILIVGGGPAGLTLATAIKNSPILAKYDTVLVDAGNIQEKVGNFYHNPPAFYTNRVVSVTPKSMKFLTEQLGVELLHDRVQPYDGLYVTDGISNAKMEIEQEEMLHMIEILNIQSSLLNKLNIMSPNAFTIRDNCKVESISSSVPGEPTSWPLVTLSNGDTYKTRLLVGADGFNSPVRRFSNIYSRGWQYDTFGLVATLKLDSHSPIYKLRGWQKFLRTGPIAHLPLPGPNATLVWSTSGDRLSKLLLEMDPQLFTQMVNAAFILEEADMDYYFDTIANGTMATDEIIEDIKSRINAKYDSLGDDSLIDEALPPPAVDIVDKTRARFPLKFTHADKYCTDRVALVGDAAHTTHPLAGQGLNMGQHDVEELARALEKATLRGQDIGSMLSLEPFWAHCYGFNNTRLGMADKLHKVYHTDSTPVVALRSLGLSLTDKISPVKNTIKDIMMGSN